MRTKEQRGHIGGIAYICAYSCSSSSIRPSLLRFLILLLLLLLLLLLIHLFLPAYVSTYQARAAHVPDTGRRERASAMWTHRWQDGCSSFLNCILVHIPHKGNSPGDCFWMGWWGYAKREELRCRAARRGIINDTVAVSVYDWGATHA